MRRAIRKHLRDFLAILVMIVLALVVGLFILGNQRFYLPGWVPLLGKDFYTLKAQFRSAQSVTPGQGQTVNIAGVPIGDITEVELVDGRAVVTMKVQKDKYDAGIYQDATMLLRPRTGLNDMFIELDPGTPSAGKLRSGATISAANTAPNVNPDEILAALDTDTRQYLKLLIGSGAEGLRDNGQNLRAVFARLGPTNRDIARITTAVAQRRRNLSRLVNRFQLLANEVATKDRQLSELVDASNAVFQAFASQDRALAESVRLLPGALTATEDALRGTNEVARNLGPAARKLLPGARALPKTLRETRPFFRETVGPIQNQLRPFSVAVQPTVKSLRPAAADLAQATPHLTNTFTVLNFLLNELAYEPPGAENGFLYWLVWGNHNVASIFSAADAGGPLRRGVIGVSCTNLATLEVAAQSSDTLKILVEMLNAPTRASTGCP